MLGNRASSRQDLVIQLVAGLLLTFLCVAAWVLVHTHVTLIDYVRLNRPDKAWIALKINLDGARFTASSHSVVLLFFMIVGMATAQNARAVPMWPQTTAGSFRLAAWSALAFACVALSIAALLAPLVPFVAMNRQVSLGAAPACVAAAMCLQWVGTWLASHAIHRGWDIAGRGRGKNLDVLGCGLLGIALVMAQGLLSYGYATFPFDAHVPRPDGVSRADLAIVPFHWLTGRLGLPDPACLAFAVGAGLLSALAGAWLVAMEPLRPGMVAGFAARRMRNR